MPTSATPISFTQDLGRAFQTWRRQPLLPVLSFLIWSLNAFSNQLMGNDKNVALMCSVWLAVGVLSIYLSGWPGSERIWYLRDFRGQTLSAREALRFSGTFCWRFLSLGILVGFASVLVALCATFAFGYSFKDLGRQSPGGLPCPLPVLAVMLGFGFVLDALGTFVTPALTYSTDSSSAAISLGWKTLKEHLLDGAFYIFLPPCLVLVVLNGVGPPIFGPILGVLLSGIAALVNLLFKGAVASFYLRLHPEVGDCGATSTPSAAPAAAP